MVWSFLDDKPDVFFDRRDLKKITNHEPIRHILGSRCMVTVMDPESFFDSEYVELENRLALLHGIDILTIFDGQKYKWKEDIDMFDWQTIEYNHAHLESAKKQLLGYVHEALTKR
eukprot:gnl/TRDRNA2_/TRDRNA2_117874_c2_seq1.p1 gnl/TRDRNA2_/TRDRNA2_117874_c2~~gnl/TRDRNA2_/TRDRNA2_117874_c2_seq1.p1  ORF type:complete len:115 (-),score=21.32 gnl/TRDRNA2_/TRDRNA2_117874_c2_seq1:40-384(-)